MPPVRRDGGEDRLSRPAEPGSERLHRKRGDAAMNMSEGFIRKPVATILLTVGITLIGFIAFRQLPISALPTVDTPTIQVTAQLPGADPQTMGSSVATPLERQFGEIAG